jgi:hypothetical protein
MATTLKINHDSIGVEKTVCQTGKGSDPLFKYNCLCLQVNPIVGHLKIIWYRILIFFCVKQS